LAKNQLNISRNNTLNLRIKMSHRREKASN
jgi:hypothetical protein